MPAFECAFRHGTPLWERPWQMRGHGRGCCALQAPPLAALSWGAKGSWQVRGVQACVAWRELCCARCNQSQAPGHLISCCAAPAVTSRKVVSVCTRLCKFLTLHNMEYPGEQNTNELLHTVFCASAARKVAGNRSNGTALQA